MFDKVHTLKYSQTFQKMLLGATSGVNLFGSTFSVIYILLGHMVYLMRKITFYDECMAKHERTAYGSRSENIERIDRLDTNRFGTSSGHLIRNLELYLGHKLLI